MPTPAPWTLTSACPVVGVGSGCSRSSMLMMAQVLSYMDVKAGADTVEVTTGGARAGGDFVQTVARALAVIRAFNASSPELTLSEVARATGLSRGAARRFLHTLVELGYVRSDGRKFALTARVLELGYSYLSSLTLPELALPHITALATELVESVSLAVLDQGDIVCVACVPSPRIVKAAITVGSRYPAYAAAAGRVLLAGLTPAELDVYLDRTEPRKLTERTVTSRSELRAVIDDARSRGWAVIDQELEVGLVGAAVPVRDAADQVVASLHMPVSHSPGALEAAPDTLVPRMLLTAEKIESELGRVSVAGAGSRGSASPLPR
jgi:IclR family transcriptional regulator, pca regulon regulatory protein